MSSRHNVPSNCTRKRLESRDVGIFFPGPCNRHVETGCHPGTGNAERSVDELATATVELSWKNVRTSSTKSAGCFEHCEMSATRHPGEGEPGLNSSARPAPNGAGSEPFFWDTRRGGPRRAAVFSGATIDPDLCGSVSHEFLTYPRVPVAGFLGDCARDRSHPSHRRRAARRSRMGPNRERMETSLLAP